MSHKEFSRIFLQIRDRKYKKKSDGGGGKDGPQHTTLGPTGLLFFLCVCVSGGITPST
jgi:hypothetical protein